MAPYKCPDCGVWWTGLEHRCQPLQTSTDILTSPIVIRPYAGPTQSGGTTSMPWCSTCQGWHIPGMGTCTATYSVAGIVT